MSRSASRAPACAASAQRTPSKPTASTTRRLPPVLMRSRASSTSRSSPAMRCAEVRALLRRAAENFLHPIERIVKRVLPRPPFGAALGDARDQCLRVRRAGLHGIALHDGALESLQRRHLSHAHVTVADGAVELGRRDGAEAQQNGEEHGHDRDAGGYREIEERRAARSHALSVPRQAHVDAKRKQGAVDDERGHAEAHEGNVTPVSGSTATLPATVTASWHSVSTTQATPTQLKNAWLSATTRPARFTKRGSPRVTRP